MHIRCTYTHIITHTNHMLIHTHIHTHTYIHAYIHTCTHIPIRASEESIALNSFLFNLLSESSSNALKQTKHTYMHIYTSIYTYMHTYTHILIYSYTHTYSHNNFSSSVPLQHELNPHIKSRVFISPSLSAVNAENTLSRSLYIRTYIYTYIHTYTYIH